jgi:CHASE2 domain-containing sensor protein
VNIKRVTRHWLFVPAMGAVLTLCCGLLLHTIRQGEWWENASYDSLTHFGTYRNTNVVLITMDNYSYRELGQERGPGKHWARKLHAQLLNKLADDQAKLVALDIIFKSASDTNFDDVALANAISRQGHVVLWQDLELSARKPESADNQPIPPPELFAQVAAGFGIGHGDTNRVARRHWPFPSPYSDPDKFSLPWKVAVMSGAQLPLTKQERWLRYYGEGAGCTKIRYVDALHEPAGFFRGKVVWIGQEPETPNPDIPEPWGDKFRTPYGYAVGGVEILATTYLNLVRGDWLRRPPIWFEKGLVVFFGILLGAGLTLMRRWIACVASVLVFLVVLIAAACISYYKYYWFSWLTLAGGQLPCALAWAWFAAPMRRRKAGRDETMVLDFGDEAPQADRPHTPDYELADEPFGKGAYGRVWLAKNAIGQWQALKAVYIAGFQNRTDPYDREFNGITRYKPVSEKHAGLLRIDFISQKKPEGYFYYVMELGDSLTPGWEKDPTLYKPKDLATVRKEMEGNRLPAAECIRIGIDLCDALDFLHTQGLTHRDIKPQNIIFVRGHPKLADVGLIAEIRANPLEGTWVGTPGYMPPLPEPPGTAPADIYGLGMVLYVISTGREPGFFPEIATTLAQQTQAEKFLPLNTVILKACQSNIAQRYASAAEMREGLRAARRALDGN